MARQSERLAEIRRLLQSQPIHYQRDLVDRLIEAGFAVTQSSVSRDLRTLRAVKLDGRYVLPDLLGSGDDSNGTGANGLNDGRYRDVAALREIRTIRPAGPNLIVIHTETGLAPRVGLLLDRLQWDEVVGTIAGDDCVFVATTGARAYRRFHDRIAPFLAVATR